MACLISSFPHDYAASRFPTEIWDDILGKVDEVADLASLAGTCQRLHSIAVPNHLHYRSLHSSVANTQLWLQLSQSRLKAQRVRQLHLYGDVPHADESLQTLANCCSKEGHGVYPLLFPESFSSPHPGDNWSHVLQRGVVAATYLRELALCMSMNQFMEMGPLYSELPSALRGLHIHVTGDDTLRIFGPGWNDEYHVNYEAWTEKIAAVFSRFKGGYDVFSWTSKLLHDICDEVLLNVSSLLAEKCPDLEKLKIVNRDRLSKEEDHTLTDLWEATWPKLKTLHLDGLEGIDNIFHTFGERHTNLEDITLLNEGFREAGLFDIVSVPKALPHLQAFASDHDVLELWTILISPMADGSYRPIKTLGFDLRVFDHRSPWASLQSFERFCHHAAKLSNFCELSILDGEPREAAPGDGPDFFLPCLGILARDAQNIRILTIQPRRITDMHGGWHYDRVDTWAETLGRHRELVELHGRENGFLAPIEGTAEAILAALERACPNLRRVDEWVKAAPGVWIKNLQ